MAILDRTCKECIFYVKQECIGKLIPCSKWIYKKANCRVCVFLEDCFRLGKGVSESKVCLNFEKEKNPPKSLKGFEVETIDEEAEFSPVDMVENIISSDYDSRVFQLIDDRDIPKADNPIKFIINKKFLGITLFPMQFKIFLEFFSSYCPWCSDSKFISNIVVDTPVQEIMDRTVPFRNGVCKRCSRTRYEAVQTGKLQRYDTLIGVAGQRSGKSISVGILSAAVLHQFLTLKGNPVEYFGLLHNSTLHGTFVGLRYNDAYDNLWEPFYNIVKSSKWYQDYHSFLASEGQRIGVELVKVRDTFLAYKWKNIGIYPSGPDRRTLRGRCIPGYSLINTNKGFIRADDKENLIGSITIKGKSTRKIINHIYQGKKEVYRATLSNGIELDCTYDHRVLILKEDGTTKWTRQENLLDKYVFCQLGGDFPEELLFNYNIQIPKCIKKVTLPNKMTPKLARLIGYLIADKNLFFSESISFFSTNIIEDFENIFYEIFNYSIKRTNNCKSCFKHNVAYYVLKNFFIYLGLLNTKVLPWCILQSPRECVVECLSAMISYDENIINSQNLVSIFYTSKSKILLKQIQLMIMKLGYICNYKSKRYIVIPKLSALKFLKNEYTGLNKARWKKDKIINRKSYTHYKIPFNDYICSKINECFNEYPCNIFNIDKSIIFSKVIKVEALGKKKVYDIEVDNDDSIFPVENVLVHNTRIISSLDEMGWFLGSEGSMKLDPDEVYNALDNSLMTVQTASRKLFKDNPGVPTAVGLYISSPSSKTDKSMRMYKQSLGSNRIYGFHKSTWEFNPNITREDLQQKFNEDPITAERDFGANPPFGINPYIKGPSALVNIFSDRKNTFNSMGYKVVEGSLNESLIYPKISFRGRHTFPSLLSIDAGYSGNSFACVLSHFEFDNDNEKVFTVSGILEIIPNPYPISFVYVYEKVISRIIQEYDVRLVTCDRWQSIDLSQRVFKDFGIDSLLYSVKYADFEMFKHEVYGETIVFPKLESPLEDMIELDTDINSLISFKPCNHLFLQLLMCKDTGRMVTKGDDITDDILRALVLGYAVINNEEYEDLFTGTGQRINTNYMSVSNIVKLGYKSSLPGSGMIGMPSLNNIKSNSSVTGVGNFRGRLF